MQRYSIAGFNLLDLMFYYEDVLGLLILLSLQFGEYALANGFYYEKLFPI